MGITKINKKHFFGTLSSELGDVAESKFLSKKKNNDKYHASISNCNCLTLLFQGLGICSDKFRLSAG